MNPKSILELRHFILSINVIDKKKHILQKKFDYGCHRGFGSSPFLQKIWVSRLKELWNDFHRSLRNSLKLHILGRLCQGISIIRRLNRFFILHLSRFFCCFLHFFIYKNQGHIVVTLKNFLTQIVHGLDEANSELTQPLQNKQRFFSLKIFFWTAMKHQHFPLIRRLPHIIYLKYISWDYF